ncbi:GRAM domain-containing protein [Gilbertella persicaria]|uniref:GRAM domain-containing protein n=1 Tax=Gilbertella persicaria TaxID=101096 RepID=UPI00221E9F6A|nr:GRAM domain-containing protein [Gilbertella persicaria]KAI8069065.1 GRAM domain-containing protein [Gilbertella persicaria]
MQSDTKHSTTSRAPSPVPSAVLYETNKTNHSSPHLPLPHAPQRRSSFSADHTTEQCLEKPLVSQRSFPHLRKKHRRESDTTFANEKRNHDFHALFRSVPDHERLIDDYGCALQKEILLQGRVYISEHHLCFNANIFGWITNLVIAFADIEDIEKRSTAIFIPNAILISTSSSKHFLASFLSRDQAYDQMVENWKASKTAMAPIDDEEEDDTTSAFSDDEFSSSSDYSEDELVRLNDTPNKDRQGSLASLPLPKHASAEEVARRRAISEVGQRPMNMQDETKEATEANQLMEKTECDCSKNNQHFPTTVMDNTYDTTIDTMYNLLYNSSFMHTFLTESEKSTDVCIGTWSEGSEGCIRSRESSYVKYLGGSIGPRTTKCYLDEQVQFCDLSNYVSQLTITRTPDVPSGGSFTVKTRTCLSWCGQGQVRVLVTVLVDFTKSSWLKSTIEKATIDGQQTFYKNLDAAVRKQLDKPKRTHPKKKRRPRHHRKQATEIPAQQDTEQHAWMVNGLNWIISHAKPPNTAQLTVICMAIMVLTNMYIALKMAGVDKQLDQMGHSQTDFIYPKLRNHNKEQDDQLEFSKTAKIKLDQRMLELEKMIQKAGENMEQVTQVVRGQRKRILNQ